MKVAFFDTHRFEKPLFIEINQGHGHEISFLEVRLTEDTAGLAQGAEAVCCFVNDHLNAKVLTQLAQGGVKMVALRSAGFNHVDLKAAKELGMTVARVPAYSPASVAEHAVTLILALNRKICKAVSRVRDLNFSLDGLVGFDLEGKTVGVIGAGKIGSVLVRILRGFRCHVLVYDPQPTLSLPPGADLERVTLEELYRRSDIVSLNLPLNKETYHMINDKALAQMKKNVMLINTGRGALIDTKALIGALKKGTIGSAGLDVYEEEENIFFQDLSEKGLQDDLLARLMTFPNVLITAHQGFLTHEALHNIASTTLQNLTLFARGQSSGNEL